MWSGAAVAGAPGVVGGDALLDERAVFFPECHVFLGFFFGQFLERLEQLAGDDGLQGKVSAYLNMDMVGHLRDKLYLQGTGSSQLWAREIERRNVPVGLAIATKADPYLPTDVTPFYMQGVPVLNAFTGAHENYSSPRDTADQLNYDGLRDTARLMAGIARSLARSDSEPDYVEVERSGGGMSRKHLRGLERTTEGTAHVLLSGTDRKPEVSRRNVSSLRKLLSEIA